MNIKQRKKDIARKLEYIGIDKKAIKEIITYHYNIIARLKKEDIRLEMLVYHHYNDIKYSREEMNKSKIKLMSFNYKFKDIFYS